MPSRRTPLMIANYIKYRGSPPPDLDWITDSLAVGGAIPDHQIQAIHTLGVGSVVDLRCESRDNVAELNRLGIRFLHLPTRDWHPPTVEDLERGSAWVLDEMAQGRKVLVHCQHGIGRSVILVAVVLVRMGYDWQEALRLVRVKRWGASPNAQQVSALAEFAQQHKREPAT